MDISGCDNPSAASTSALFLIWYSEFLRFKATKNKPANAFFQYVVFALNGIRAILDKDGTKIREKIE